MAIIGIDFESFYSRDYSLSKISTQAYVDHPHFEVIGVAVKVDDEPSEWFSGTMEETKVWLDKFNWKNAWVYAHNALFDATILTWRFDIKPKLWLDTLSMARAVHGTEVGGSLAKLAIHYELGEKGTEVVSALGKRRADFTEEELAKYGEYCINDVDLTHGLFLNLAPHFNKTEIMLIDMTVRMHSEPQFILDVPTLLDHLYHTKKRKEELLTASGIAKEDLMSNPKFAEILRTYGVTPPLKISPATGKETYAFAKTDEDMKALLDYPDFDVQAIVAARLGTRSTIEESRTERFIEIAESGGVLPIPLKYYGADVTGRWSGCVVADTLITVYDEFHGVTKKPIVDVLLSDLVWDGEEFVTHEGVVFTGYSETITWDGITGTEDHVVFTEKGEISLYRAMQGQHRITVANSITKDAVDSARRLTSSIKKQATL
jgi:hypothetical protein